MIDFHQLTKDHAEWSEKTFGDVSHKGPLEHLKLEADEALEDPTGEEFADLFWLTLDAARRAGISPQQLLEHAETKLEILKQRDWPQAVEGQPCQHKKPDTGHPVIHNIGTAHCVVGTPEQLGMAFASVVGDMTTNCTGRRMDFEIGLHQDLSAIELRHYSPHLKAKIELRPLLEAAARNLAEAVKTHKFREDKNARSRS